MQPVLLIGGGGHCRSCIDVIESTNHFYVGGIVDTLKKVGEKIYDYDIVGTDADLPKLRTFFSACLITLGQLTDPEPRRRLWGILNDLRFLLPVVSASSARISRHASIGAGTVLMHSTNVNADAWIGENCIINTGAVIEHGARVGCHSHISTGAYLNGDCEIGSGCLLGSCAVVRNGVRISDNIIIGAGSVVAHNILDPGVYVGNPARRIHG